MRDAIYSIKSSSAVLPSFQVGQLCPGDVQVFYAFSPCIRFAVQGDTYNIETFAFILFVCFQQYFIEGMTAGAVKE